MRRILCPVDLSDFSRRALQYAALLSGWFEAEITVLSVRPVTVPPALWLTPESIQLPETPEDRDRATRELEAFARSAGGEPNRTLIRHGTVAAEILRAARELPADLIAMGTHGTSGFERLFLGSVTAKVARKAACPVLTVPKAPEGAAGPPNLTNATIVCGMDRSSASARALQYALALVARGKAARLVIVHVLEDVSAEEPRFAEHFNVVECWREIAPEIRATYEALVPPDTRASCNVEVRVPFGKAYRELLDVARDVESDLIVIGAAGRETPFGATTQHVLRAADCPVLIVPGA